MRRITHILVTAFFFTSLLRCSVSYAQTPELPSGQSTQSPGSSTPNPENTTQNPSNPNVQPLQLPPVLNPPITNISPAQELADQEKNRTAPLSVNVPRALPNGEPDIEFQEFVTFSLGKRLPIFGHNLFEGVPSTFAPLDRVQVPGDYAIGPGDEIIIRTWGLVDINYQAVVDRSGSIYLPKVGTFSVAGVKYDDLHDYIQSQIAHYFKSFQLSVSMGRLRSIQIFAVGQVKRPGTYTISSLSSLVDALFACGGPSKRGSMRQIQVKRDGKIVTTFDLYDLLVNGDKSKDVTLRAGDVVYVPAVGPLVALGGSINAPAIYELKGKNTLADAISYAGGVTSTAAGDYAVVERIENHLLRKVDEFPLDSNGFARELHDGDIVRFQRISPRFENSITLRGNVARPGRYPWHQGMRIHDLIPDRDFLVTEEYWKRQTQQVVDAQTPDFRLSQTDLKNDVKRVSAEINWEYAAIQRFDPQALTSHLLPFNLGRAIQGDDRQNLPLQPGDIVTIFSQADIRVPLAQQSKFVHLEGEVARAGVYQIEPGETLRHLLVRIGGFTPQAYLFGSDFTRESTRVDQQQRLDAYTNDLATSLQQQSAAAAIYAGDTSTDALLAKADVANQRTVVSKLRATKATGRIVLEIKPQATSVADVPDMPLEDGDRLLVPFHPATVNVIGSVYNNGSFLYKPGKTVSDYLHLSGGSRRDGDKRHEFVIRADGSTVSRSQHHALLSRDFNMLKLMPGDTIVVPQKTSSGAFLRGLRDWSTLISGFGLTAAAIGTLLR